MAEPDPSYRDVIQHNTFLTKSSVLTLVLKSLICRIDNFSQMVSVLMKICTHEASTQRDLDV